MLRSGWKQLLDPVGLRIGHPSELGNASHRLHPSGLAAALHRVFAVATVVALDLYVPSVDRQLVVLARFQLLRY